MPSALDFIYRDWLSVRSSLLLLLPQSIALAAPVLAMATAVAAAVAAAVVAVAADADAAAAPGVRAAFRRVHVRARRPAPTRRRCGALRPAQWPCCDAVKGKRSRARMGG